MEIKDKKVEEILEEAEGIRETLIGTEHAGYFNYRFFENTAWMNEEEKKRYAEFYKEVSGEEPDESVFRWIEYELIECYYDGNDNIIAWSQGPTSIWCENRQDLKSILRKAKKASYKNTVALVDGKMIDTGRKMDRKWKK